MLNLPQKTSLAAQVLEIIRSEIAVGNWRDWLPAERALSDLLKISRPTLRSALKSLELEEAIEPIHGRGYRILARPTRSVVARQVTVHLLSPDPLEQVRHHSSLWIEELRFKLFKSGHDFQFHHGVQYLRRGAEKALARLVAQNPDGLWVLVHSSRVIQRWFTANSVSAVIVGYRHEDCDLPHVVVNMDAVCRHAAGELIRLGHRRLALIRLKTDRAGDLQSDRSFQDGALHASNEVQVQLLYYDEDTPAAIARTLQRMMRAAYPPTGLLVAHASGYATVVTWLSERAVRVPRDLSLICRDYDSFLNYLIPRPSYYQYEARTFALKIESLIQQLIEQPNKSPSEIHVIPEYMAGNSVGPAPSAERGGKKS